ncbi:MAG: serine hydrolase, partial [Candidatus Eisenbacteria bacterium]|nr:serine hydrolase [Candidatus Latescibacterota bacterium]MBD3303435.1 serine hydrolase [Candidatus Eisenbacteria bacterium]
MHTHRPWIEEETMRGLSRSSSHVVVGAIFAALIVTPLFGSKAGAADLEAELDSILEEVFAPDHVPGAAVAVVRGEEVVYTRGFGTADVESERPVTPETVFYIASSTKPFLGLAARILHERGTIDLNESLKEYLPDVRLAEPLDPTAITLLDLLTHTHGIENDGPVTFRTAYTGEFTPALLIRLLEEHGPAEKGREFEYGNLGYNVASLALDANLDENWKEVLRSEIFEPLGMASTTANVSEVPRARLAMPHGAEPDGFRRLPYGKEDANMHAAGGLVSTVTDLARWLEVNINDGRIDGRRVFAPSAIRATHRELVEQDSRFIGVHRSGYGMGWAIGSYDDDVLLQGFGGYTGFHSHVSFMPEHDVGIVMLVNAGRLGAFLADIGSRAVYDRLLEKPESDSTWVAERTRLKEQMARFRGMIREDRDRRAARSQELPRPLGDYAGTYENPLLGTMTWSVADGKLAVRMGVQR